MFFSVSRVKGYLGKIGITGLVLVILALSGCSTDGGGVASIYGKWVSQWGEEYRISEKNFSSVFEGSTNYTGKIIEIHEDGPDAGYITIQFTQYNSTLYQYGGSPLDPVGRYYVLHYKNLRALFVELSQAYNDEDPDSDSIEADYGWGYGPSGGSAGKATKALAESTYTVEGGYFNGYSACSRK